jgi:predicted DNA-binding protein (MmcQ/YjbR family)
MNIEEFRNYCLAKEAVEECFPFDEETLVFKVGGKMFALAALERLPVSVNLKCDPDYALELREKYTSVLPGYHTSKYNWNTIVLESELPDQLMRSLIDLSYNLVFEKLTKKVRQEILDGYA